MQHLGTALHAERDYSSDLSLCSRNARPDITGQALWTALGDKPPYAVFVALKTQNCYREYWVYACVSWGSWVFFYR